MKVVIILGSTRDGRIGYRVAKFVQAEAKKIEDWDVELADLATINLPMYHDAMTPASMQGKYSDPTVSAWAAQVASAEAFIFVTPEYNHSIPAPLKNSLDTIYPEWANKAGGIVSYSMAPSGGTRAAEHLRGILGHLGVATVAIALSIGGAHQVLDAEGNTQNDGISRTLQSELAQINAWATALKTIR